jgi:hypothetical protein
LTQINFAAARAPFLREMLDEVVCPRQLRALPGHRPTSAGRLKIAPPLRSLHQRYPIENLGEALAEGISTGHADMPVFELTLNQVHDLLSYLKTLE